MNLSIVMKVSILAGSIAAFASLTVGFFIVNGSVDIVYRDALNHLKYETNIKSINLVSDIKNLRSDAQYLAATPPIRGIPSALVNDGIDPVSHSDIETWNNNLTTIFSELIRAKPQYSQIRYIGLANNGRELLRVNRNGSSIESVDALELQSKGDEPYFINAVKTKRGDIYLSDISLNREFGEISIPHTPVIRAATPIYFSGKLFGIVVINMVMGDILDELIINTPRNLTPYITNEDGYFLAHPNKAMNYGFDLGNDNKIQNLYPNLDLRWSDDLRDREVTIEDARGVLHVVKAHYDPIQQERFFALMVATSYENLQSSYDQLRYKSFLIMFILVVLSLFVTVFLASRLMRPLKLISTASDDFAKGREIIKLPVDSKDEIGDLARSFEAMKYQLSEKEHELIESQARVHHVNKMASLGEMAARMAHEINSPVQTISLVSQRVQRQLKSGVSNDDISESMDRVNHSVNKITEIIDSLGKVSRHSENESFDYVALNDIIQDTLNMSEERFKINNVHFEVTYHHISEHMLIQCQRLQISQVIINLVNNAYYAIQNSTAKWIKIDFEQRLDRVAILVSDSGSGVSPELADKIFEPMFTTKEIGEGTGLGLSISRDIVLHHNGLFYLDTGSENTCFVLEIPVVHVTN